MLQTKNMLPYTDEFDGAKFTESWARFLTYRTGLPTKSMVTATEVITQEEFGRRR